MKTTTPLGIGDIVTEQPESGATGLATDGPGRIVMMVCAGVRRENGFFKNLRTSFSHFQHAKKTLNKALNNALNSLCQDCLQCRVV